MGILSFVPRLAYGCLSSKANRDQNSDEFISSPSRTESGRRRKAKVSRLPRIVSKRPLTGLAALPKEILLCICDLLPPVDVCCLSYASPPLRYQLRGHPAIWQVRRGVNQRKIVNDRLRGFSLPYCDICKQDHHVARSRYPARRLRDVPPCIKSDEGLALTPYNADDRFKLGYHHIHLIMQNHHHPGRGLSVDALNFSHHFRRFRGEVYPERSGGLTSVDARIITDKLYLRIQDWHVFRSLCSIHQIWALKPSARPCIHKTSSLNTGFRKMLTKAIASQEYLPGQQMAPLSIIGKTITMDCDICCGVYELSVRALDDCRVAFVVTKWLELGSCEDADDRDWQRHIKRDRQLGRTSSTETKTARGLYETEGSGFDVEELTKRNEADLIEKRYRSWKRVSNVTTTTRL